MWPFQGHILFFSSSPLTPSPSIPLPQFVAKDNARHEEALHALEARLATQRDALVRCKLRRDATRAEAASLKGQCAIVTAAVLKEDIAVNRDRREALLDRVTTLQTQHKSLTGTLGRLRSALASPAATGSYAASSGGGARLPHL